MFIIICNSAGKAVAGAANPVQMILDAASAEALTLLKGLELVEKLGCTHITCESDCLELINACNGELEIFGPYTSTLADCFVRTKMINEVTFKHNPREANRVAHHLLLNGMEIHPISFFLM